MAGKRAGRRPSIPPELEGAVLGKLAEHKGSYKPVVDWLRDEHNIHTSAQSIIRLVERVTAERATVTRAQTVERLSKTTTADLDAFDADEVELKDIAAGLAVGLTKADRSKLEDCIGKTPRVVVYLNVLDRLHRIRELKLKYSGAGGSAPTDAPGVIVVPVKEI